MTIQIPGTSTQKLGAPQRAMLSPADPAADGQFASELMLWTELQQIQQELTSAELSLVQSQSGGQSGTWTPLVSAVTNPLLSLGTVGSGTTTADWLNSFGPTSESSPLESTGMGQISTLPDAPSQGYQPIPATTTPPTIDQAITDAARQYGVPENLIRGVIQTESGMNPNAISPSGAMGLMQLMPDTAKALNVSNPFDVQSNVSAGTQYLKQLLDRFHGDTKLAIAAYNAGPEAVVSYQGIPPYPETEQYVQRVLANAGLTPTP